MNLHSSTTEGCPGASTCLNPALIRASRNCSLRHLVLGFLSRWSLFASCWWLWFGECLHARPDELCILSGRFKFAILSWKPIDAERIMMIGANWSGPFFDPPSAKFYWFVEVHARKSKQEADASNTIALEGPAGVEDSPTNHFGLPWEANVIPLAFIKLLLVTCPA